VVVAVAAFPVVLWLSVGKSPATAVDGVATLPETVTFMMPVDMEVPMTVAFVGALVAPETQ
jgi:hypothetical protein